MEPLDFPCFTALLCVRSTERRAVALSITQVRQVPCWWGCTKSAALALHLHFLLLYHPGPRHRV